MKITGMKVFIAMAAAILVTGVSGFASEMDTRIESSAKQSFVFKTFLEKDDISIQSREGVVTLKGTVAEESHKALAEETVANLPGVKKVHAELKIQGKRQADNSDGFIALQVKLALLFNRYVNGFNTQVAVSKGVVTLRGESDTPAQRELAGEYAKDIKGVTGVKNEMTIAKEPAAVKESLGEIIDDASVTAQVKMALMIHHSTSALKTGVTTTNGVVTLSGETGTGAKKDLAAKVARNVNGVKDVVNNMSVSN